MAKQKDKLTLLKEELASLLKSGGDRKRAQELMKEINLQTRMQKQEKIALEGTAIFGDAYTEAAEKSAKKSAKKTPQPTFSNYTDKQKIQIQQNIRERNKNISDRSKRNIYNMSNRRETGLKNPTPQEIEAQKRIRKELDDAKRRQFVNTSDALNLKLPPGIDAQIRTVGKDNINQRAEELVNKDSTLQFANEGQRETFITDVADEMAAQVEEAARSDAGKMNIMDFSEGNPMIIDTRNGAVKDMAESVDPKSKSAAAYAKEFGIETKSATDSGFNISIRTLESQLDMITNTIENTKGERLNVEENLTPRILNIERVNKRNAEVDKTVAGLEKQKNVVSNLLEEQVETLNKETAYRYLQGKGVIDKSGSKSNRESADKIINKLNITGDKIIDVDDLDIMYKSKFEKTIQKDTPVTKEQLIMSESERLISNWQKQITPGQHAGKWAGKEGPKESQLAEPDVVDPDAAKYQTKKQSETRSKFEKSQSPMPNLLKNALQDAGTLPGEAGMISERMEYIEGVNEPRGREWWSEGEIIESAQPSASKGQKDIGSFTEGFQIKGVAGQQIDKALKGQQIADALQNPVVLETNVTFAWKPTKYMKSGRVSHLISGTMQRDVKGNIIPFTPEKSDELREIVNLGKQLKVKDFIDDKGNLTAEGRKFRVEVPKKPELKIPDWQKYPAKDDFEKAKKTSLSNFKKAEKIYLSNLDQPAVATVLQKDLPGYEAPEIELKAEASGNILRGAKSKDVNVTITGSLKDTSFTIGLDVPDKPAIVPFKDKKGKRYISKAEPVIRLEGPPKIIKETVTTDAGQAIKDAKKEIAEAKQYIKTATANKAYTPEDIKYGKANLSAAESKLKKAQRDKSPRTKEITKTESLYRHLNPQKRNVVMSEKIPQTKTVTREVKPGVSVYGKQYKRGLKDIAAQGIEIPGKVRVTDYGQGATASFEVSNSDFKKHLSKLERVKDTKYGQTELDSLAKGLRGGKAATSMGLKDFNIGSQKVFDVLYDEAVQVRNIKKGIEEKLITSSKAAYAEGLKSEPSVAKAPLNYAEVDKGSFINFMDKNNLWKKNKGGEVLLDKNKKKIVPQNLFRYQEGGDARQITKSLTYEQLKSIAPKGEKYLFESDAQRSPKNTFKYKTTGILDEKNKFTHLFKQQDYTTLRKSYEKELVWKAYKESLKMTGGTAKFSSKAKTEQLLKAAGPEAVNKILNQASSKMTGNEISKNFYKKDGSFDIKSLSQIAQQRISNDAKLYADKNLKGAVSKKFLTELKKGIKMVIGKG
jgi:hypothetical protein